MRLEDLIIKDIRSDNLKFAPVTKILSEKEITLEHHYATDHYSGAQQLKNTSFGPAELYPDSLQMESFQGLI